MRYYTILVDAKDFLSLADIEAHTDAFAIRLAITYAEEAARLYAARSWTDEQWSGPSVDMYVQIASVNAEGDIRAFEEGVYAKFVPSQYCDAERALITPISIPGVIPIPLTIKDEPL